MKMKLAKGAQKKAPEKGQEKTSPEEGVDIRQPFAGKIFYLDLTSKLLSEKLEKDIKELGGTVEGFLSREISYLVTSKKEATNPRVLKYLFSRQPPQVVKNTGESSAHQSSEKAFREGGSRKKKDKGLVSRGKSLVKKAIQEHAFLPENSILSNAWNWGVHIMHIEEAKLLIDLKKHQALQRLKEPTQPRVKKHRGHYIKRTRAQKLSKPYLKVEDNESQYKPNYLMKLTLLSFRRPKQRRPVKVDKKVSVPKATATKNRRVRPLGRKQDQKDLGLKDTVRSSAIGGENNCGRNEHFKPKEQKKSGYCECCLEKYSDLETHVVGQKHKSFSKGPHYQNVDALIGAFEFDFVEWPKFRTLKSMCMQTPKDPRNKEPDNQAQFMSQTIKLESMEVDYIKMTNTGLHLPRVSSLDKICDGSAQTISYAHHTGLVQNTNCTMNSISLKPEHIAAPPVCLKSGFPVSVGDEEMLAVANNEVDSIVNVKLEQDAVDLNLLELEQAANLEKCISESLVDGQEARLPFLSLSTFVKAPDIDPGAAQGLPAEAIECKMTPEHSFPNPVASPITPQSEGLACSKLHRKVKTLKRNRNLESQCCTPACKISVPQEANISTDCDSLMKLLESSKEDFEFFGFTCGSMNSSSEDVAFQDESDWQMLQHLLLHTSSCSTFDGF